MIIELPVSVEKELRNLAVTQRRYVGNAITDLDAAGIAEAQVK
ncbi:MAG TPA: hypothetical protein VKK31_18305 [Thermoanaerobaculia bacterium]|nr:hypothetical protein [Thermoanaerobaculia bacterium]